ncbi:alpha-(1,3)-fucosyltransferase 7 [Megalops cyprinoides]|uniref:alpha-(1,3)-fucosyltransferase 7 n=1 Tax=Megalops cyprinoides TaxID=118141 RepID=UPI001864EB76|nr:alpha-(1,3)-fucosyltransferase 7 [Megalops cyprinoides]
MGVTLPGLLLAMVALTLSTFLLLHLHLKPGSPWAGVARRRNISILLWHWPFQRRYSLQGDVCWDHFRIPGCLLWDDHTLFANANVVVFHHHELKTGRSELPLHLPRPPAQKWLWLSLESPATNGNLSRFNGLFNWTMSYRRDADIFMPYGEVVPREKANGNGGDRDFAVPKKDPKLLVCWVVSNYRTRHKRAQVYRSLRRQIPVEVFGRSVKRPLSAHELLPTISRCYFYLAFENSLFQDYITEKLWHNSYLAGTVPVVLGPPRPNYEALAPPGSFIHIDDFNSTATLATFLRGLAADSERYSSYFRWHRDYDVRIVRDWRERLCHICARYYHLAPRKVYHHLDTWTQE